MMDGYDDGLPDQGTAHECSDFHECKAAIAQAVKEERERFADKCIKDIGELVGPIIHDSFASLMAEATQVIIKNRDVILEADHE